jgi:toxin HigB-1
LTIDVKRHIVGGVIKSFHDSDTEALYNRKQCRRFQSFAKVGFKRLLTLDAARTLGDLAAVPGHRFEKLSGDRQGQYSIRINDQWRICFEWDGDAQNVEINNHYST